MKQLEIEIQINSEITLKGNLNIPETPNSVVIFSHGSGSSRFSPRNRYVAEILNKYNMATLLTDLLTEKEDSVFENRFNIELITDRLIGVTKYISQISELKNLGVGYFGASTGAASALKAAARLDKYINAVVSRGGRPDLAGDSLSEVKAPTLLIVGSFDRDVIKLNENAFSQLKCEKKMELIEGASHLFEEPGTLEEVAALAQQWFTTHLVLNPVKID